MGKGNIKEALELAGSQHTYQKLLVLLISLSWVVLNFILLGSTLVFMDPVFHCNQDLDRKVFEKEACPQIDQCELVDKFTLTAELSLYCGNEWARDLIQSIFGVGCIAGLFIMNLVSDTKSRKLASMACLSIIIFGISITLLGGWINSLPIVIIAQFVQGFGTSSILSLSYAFLSDYCSDQFKPRAVIIVNTAWSLSTVLLGVFYLISLKWWVYLLFIILLPLITVTILFHFYLLESPYILMLRNKRKQALQVLTKVATINKREQNIGQIQKMINENQSSTDKNEASIKNVLKLLKQWEYLKPIIILSVIRLVGSVNFYGTSFAFDVEGLGLGYNSMIAGFMEIISFLVLTIYVNRIPRKKGIAGFYTIVAMMGLLFLFSSVRDNLLLGTALMGTSRIFSTISYTLIASVQTEAFTNEIQSTAVGITEAFGLIGSLCGPLIVDLGDKIDIDPVVLMAIVVTFGIWPNFFLKETLNAYKKKDSQQPLLYDSLIEQDEDYHQKSLLSQSTIPSNDQL